MGIAMMARTLFVTLMSSAERFEAHALKAVLVLAPKCRDTVLETLVHTTVHTSNYNHNQ